MTTMLDRRRLLALGIAGAAMAGLPAAAVEEGPALGDIPVGSPDAPVTVIEYASFTCPHCARFHLDTWPELKAAYVDTGKVRFILREVFFDAPGLWAAMIARCGGTDPYYPIVDQLMKRQREWTGAEDRAAALQRIGRVNGLSSQQMRDCLSDRQYAERLVERYKETATADEITSTPSFVINGQLERGNIGYDEFSAILERHLAEAS